MVNSRRASGLVISALVAALLLNLAPAPTAVSFTLEIQLST